MSLKKPLIILSSTAPLTREMIRALKGAFSNTVEQELGAELFITDDSLDISVHDNTLHESINSMIKTVKELIESNDRLTKALIESYSEAEPDYDVDVPQPVYMDGSKVE